MPPGERHVRGGRRFSAKREPLGEPGEGHFYSDTNYVLLGMIVEEAAERPFREHMHRSLFEPLEMTATRFFGGDPYFAAMPDVPPQAEGYLKMSEVIRSIAELPSDFIEVEGELRNTTSAGETLPAAGGIVSTAGDLHKLSRAVFHGDALTAESRRWLLAAADGLEGEAVGTAQQRTMRGYRLGAGVVLTAEGDGPGGCNAMLAFHPETGTTVIGLTNIFGLWTESDLMLEQLERIVADLR